MPNHRTCTVCPEIGKVGIVFAVTKGMKVKGLPIKGCKNITLGQRNLIQDKMMDRGHQGSGEDSGMGIGFLDMSFPFGSQTDQRSMAIVAIDGSDTFSIRAAIQIDKEGIGDGTAARGMTFAKEAALCGPMEKKGWFHIAFRTSSARM